MLPSNVGAVAVRTEGVSPVMFGGGGASKAKKVPSASHHPPLHPLPFATHNSVLSTHCSPLNHKFTRNTTHHRPTTHHTPHQVVKKPVKKVVKKAAPKKVVKKVRPRTRRPRPRPERPEAWTPRCPP